MIIGESQQIQYRLAKVLGVMAIMASAVTNEYGVTINLASVQSVSLYPRIEYWVPWAMIVAGLLLLPKVLMYMRFSNVMPCAGSVYVWIGRTVSLPVGFVVSFLNWISLTAAIGLVAFAFGTFLSQALVSAGFSGGFVFATSIGHILLGLTAIWLIYALHISGVANYGMLVTIVFWLIVAVVLVIVSIGFSTSTSTFLALAQHASGVKLQAPAQAPVPDLGSFLAVSGLFVAAYGGLNAATSLGGEANDPTRTTSRGLFWGWMAALILYSAVLLALFHAVPWWSITDLVQSKASAFATAPGLVDLVAPQFVGTILGLVVALIVGKTLAPIMMVSSRSLFAWAEDGLISPMFGITNIHKAPRNALLLTCIVASLFLFQSTLIGWSIGLVIRSVVILVVMILVGFGAWRTRFSKKLSVHTWAQQISEGWWIPLVSVLMIVIGAILLWNVAIVPKTPWEFQPLFQGAVATVIGIMIYKRAVSSNVRRGIHIEQIAREIPIE